MNDRTAEKHLLQPPSMPAARAAAACPPGAADWTIHCDFDGTISVDDVTDSLLQRFGRPGWEAIEADWERGAIGSRECMTRQIALLDMSEAELTAHLDTLAIDPHFAAFVAAAGRLGIPVQVVSDGLDRAIGHVLGRHRLHALPVFANRLLQTGERQWVLEAPYADAHCLRASGNCKCARAAEQQALSRRLLYIGDGSSDFCVSGRADQVLAKASLIDHCRREGIAHRPFTDFGDALEMMQAIVTEGPARARGRLSIPIAAAGARARAVAATAIPEAAIPAAATAAATAGAAATDAATARATAAAAATTAQATAASTVCLAVEAR